MKTFDLGTLDMAAIIMLQKVVVRVYGEDVFLKVARGDRNPLSANECPAVNIGGFVQRGDNSTEFRCTCILKRKSASSPLFAPQNVVFNDGLEVMQYHFRPCDAGGYEIYHVTEDVYLGDAIAITKFR